MIGQTISYYRIVERLGEGGMGVVYKAEDSRLQRPVALKFLSPNSVATYETKARFVREARAAAALQHPNICTVYEIGEHGNRSHIAMAYLEGQVLTKRIAQGPLSVERLLEVGVQIAQGLQEAHRKGIVHRDIKSANIMDTLAVLMDFGLAQLSSATSKLTREGMAVGTSAYMSPEQATGGTVDHRTDLWTLGVVLYEMSTGELPFTGHCEPAIQYAIQNETPKPVTTIRSELPAELDRIIGRCLTKRPCAGRRYRPETPRPPARW